jgi:pyrroline-5-carboxylate reductase
MFAFEHFAARAHVQNVQYNYVCVVLYGDERSSANVTASEALGTAMAASSVNDRLSFVAAGVGADPAFPTSVSRRFMLHVRSSSPATVVSAAAPSELPSSACTTSSRKLLAEAGAAAGRSSCSGANSSHTLGFVGVGTINAAVVRGLCTASTSRPEAIIVGPRNKSKAAELVAEFNGIVTQAATNEAVLDGCDVVFLATPPGPDALREACAPLPFRADHTVICLVAGVSYEQLLEVIHPARTAVIAMPLPPAQVHASTTVMFPPNSNVEALLSPLGTVVPVATFKEAMTVGVLGCVMGHFYKHLETVESWLLENGINEKTAAAATGKRHVPKFCCQKSVERDTGYSVVSSTLINYAVPGSSILSGCVRWVGQDPTSIHSIKRRRWRNQASSQNWWRSKPRVRHQFISSSDFSVLDPTRRTPKQHPNVAATFGDAGGMNEQVISQILAEGGFEHVKTALDTLLPRLLGTSS